MSNHKRLKRHMRLAASAVAATAVVGGAAIATGQAGASPFRSTHSGLHRFYDPRFKPPTLRHGVLSIEGTNAADSIALRLKAGDPTILEVVGDNGSVDFQFARAKISAINVDAGRGNDLVSVDESNGVFTDSIRTTLAGGPGDDNLAGGSGAETLVGGDGNDRIDGNKGSDLALMGAGDDTFVWDPGDGSDKVEGQDGRDAMLFNGAAGAEHVDLSANGNRLRFFRDVASITMDTAGVEQVDFDALGGADVVTVHNLSGTDVKQVNVDESSPAGSGTGDGQADQVIVEGTNGADNITAVGQQRGNTRRRALRDGDDLRCGACKRHPLDRRVRRQRPRRRLRPRRERGQVDDRRWERQRRPDRWWWRRRAHRRGGQRPTDRRSRSGQPRRWSGQQHPHPVTVELSDTTSAEAGVGLGGRPRGRPPLFATREAASWISRSVDQPGAAFVRGGE